MKNVLHRSASLLAVTVVFALAATAQQSGKPSPAADQYVISAKAGAVNYVEGKVMVVSKDGRSNILLKRDQLDIGDRVATGENGRVEILLNPGSYVRLGPNSELKFMTTSLEDLQLRVNRGSAMFEVFATNEFRVTVGTAKGAASIVDSGIYRVDVQPDGAGTIAVFDGKAIVGDVALTQVKGGRTAPIARQNVSVAKFDRGKGNKDDLSVWSKSRGKELAKMTSSLKNAAAGSSLISSFNSGRWSLFNSFGLWVYLPSPNTYCFLPFGYGWSSPYGYGYGMGLYWYNHVWNDPRYYPMPIVRDTNGIRQPPEQAPPFKKLERERVRDNIGGVREIDPNGEVRGPTRQPPVYSPPSSSPPNPSPIIKDVASPTERKVKPIDN